MTDKEEAAKSKTGKAASEKKICFVMMPIGDVEGYPTGHFGEVYKDLIQPAVEASGYECQLASSTSSAHLIQLQVVTKAATADLCICDLSTNNPNVLFEYGIRQAFDKPTVLLKDSQTKRIFDLNGFRDIEYDVNLRYSAIMDARERLVTAIAHTVAGKDDKGQIFSLVQLMRLTKASIPNGENPSDFALFQLLSRQLNVISEKIESIESKFNTKNFLNYGVVRRLPDENVSAKEELDSIIKRVSKKLAETIGDEQPS